MTGPSVWFQLGPGLHYLYIAWWSFVAALVSLVLVSLFTAPLPPDQLRPLVLRQGPS